PSVILYTDEQLQDIGLFCCQENEGTILGVDKTYNFGQLHLTTTVFKNLSVVRTDTAEPPIFLGPSFLHGKSDFTTFDAFFSHIASHLSDSELKRLVVGSDDEQALRKSIQRSFPGATHILCTRHLKNNWTSSWFSSISKRQDRPAYQKPRLYSKACPEYRFKLDKQQCGVNEQPSEDRNKP
ncbi:hypothetical protein MAR_014448, partial [Mya arenaria]